MGYIGVITHLITNHLLTSWDIQADPEVIILLGIFLTWPMAKLETFEEYTHI